MRFSGIALLFCTIITVGTVHHAQRVGAQDDAVVPEISIDRLQPVPNAVKNVTPSITPVPTPLRATTVSPRVEFPQPLPPASLPRKRTNGSIPQQVMIEFCILETDSKLDITLNAVSLEPDGNQGGVLQLLGAQAQKQFVEKLVKSQAAKVISCPKIITLNGQAAQVEIGKQVTLKAPGPPGEKATVGLKLNCLPTINDDRLIIELDCENSKLHEGYRIDTRTLKTSILMDWENTVAVKGLGENLLVLATPHRVKSQTVKASAVYPSPPKAFSPDPKAASLAKIQGFFDDIESAELNEIMTSDDQILIKAKLARGDQDKIPSLLEKLASLAPLKVSNISTSMLDSGIRLEIRCEFPNARTRRSDEPLKDLHMALKALYPDEKVELAMLPDAVLLRGKVQESTARRMVDIASQYHPTVINHLDIDSTFKGTGGESNSSLSEQLDGLSSEVKSLRIEVQRLIHDLKSQPEQTRTTPPPISSY